METARRMTNAEAIQYMYVNGITDAAETLIGTGMSVEDALKTALTMHSNIMTDIHNRYVAK